MRGRDGPPGYYSTPPAGLPDSSSTDPDRRENDSRNKQYPRTPPRVLRMRSSTSATRRPLAYCTASIIALRDRLNQAACQADGRRGLANGGIMPIGMNATILPRKLTTHSRPPFLQSP